MVKGLVLVSYKFNFLEVKKNIALLIAIVAVLIGFLAFWGGLEDLVVRWNKQEEYGHGYFIPLISAWFLWERREALASVQKQSSFAGVLLVFFAMLLLLLGEVTAFYLAIQLGFVMFLMGVVLGYGGKSLFKLCFVPLLFLIFCIPLPYFLEALLTARLQLLSSELGVIILRALGTSVYLEGNVIDLGQYQLQVVEACSGLRYLYPLMGIAFMMAYMYRANFLPKLIVFLSSIPITVFMNSARIAVVGVLVEHWGSDMADGFLHYFEGWIVFMICLLILVAEIWAFEYVGQQRKLFVAIDTPTFNKLVNGVGSKITLRPLWSILTIVFIGSLLVLSLSSRVEVRPPRKPLDNFPLKLESWLGEQDRLGQSQLDLLGLEDYILADYRPQVGGHGVNLYVAYYASQRKGVSPHSPQVCMPGGGWVITSLQRVKLVDEKQSPFIINKVLIEKGQDKQLVYYWYQQRGRRIASEYEMKLFLLKDAIFMNRTDGALVRLVTNANDGVEQAEQRLKAFVGTTLPLLNDYVPG